MRRENPRRRPPARPWGFKPYPAYKDSGVEWLGEIPAHWEVKRLWHVVQFRGRVHVQKETLCTGAARSLGYRRRT